MNAPIETPVGPTSTELMLKINSPLGAVATTLALYGAQAVVRDTRRRVIKTIESQKTRRALRKAEQAAPQA